MKRAAGIVVSLVIGALSFGVMAVEEVQKDKIKEMNLTKIGTVSTSDATAPMDARAELVKKAEELGGKYYVITSADQPGKDIRATADVYK
ncbi:YdgH/BhsA/McbA-like domain containing protein [Pseudescherichia sp.]|uniref:YdgH/BhsA/McbA-like domain containing protein n=1 Tax=Pseudescherichia sp. TaxID=2055881 RepID=UPI0028A096CF|nr:YdgH/BhsA/McbA-like domain containing protein [Pseudescherichia sp.]